MRAKRAQVWSVDTMIAFVVFLSAVSFFLIFISFSNDSEKIETVKVEAEYIPQVLSAESGTIPLIENNKVNIGTLEALANMPYNDLKNLLGIKSEFCIFFKDRENNLVNLSEVLGQPGNRFGIGDGTINISKNIPCG